MSLDCRRLLAGVHELVTVSRNVYRGNRVKRHAALNAPSAERLHVAPVAFPRVVVGDVRREVFEDRFLRRFLVRKEKGG